MALTLFAWVHARTALLSTLRSLPTAPGSLGSSFAALIRVVILVVPLIFTLFSFAHELQSALRYRTRIVHVVHIGGGLVNRPSGWILSVRILVWVGHKATPSALAANGYAHS
jgi:hypothetical protein